MICIGSDTDIGMNRNSSDWLGMNSYPILSSGMHSLIDAKLFSFGSTVMAHYDFKAIGQAGHVTKIIC